MPRNPSFSHPPKIPPTNSTQKSALNPEKQKLASKVRGQMQIHQIFQAHLGETLLLLANIKRTKFCIVTSAVTWLTGCFFDCSFCVSLEFGYKITTSFVGYCMFYEHVYNKIHFGWIIGTQNYNKHDIARYVLQRAPSIGSLWFMDCLDLANDLRSAPLLFILVAVVEFLIFASPFRLSIVQWGC